MRFPPLRFWHVCLIFSPLHCLHLLFHSFIFLFCEQGGGSWGRLSLLYALTRPHCVTWSQAGLSPASSTHSHSFWHKHTPSWLLSALLKLLSQSEIQRHAAATRRRTEGGEQREENRGASSSSCEALVVHSSFYFRTFWWEWVFFERRREFIWHNRSGWVSMVTRPGSLTRAEWMEGAPREG